MIPRVNEQSDESPKSQSEVVFVVLYMCVVSRL
jgi:hypothetical protein